MNQPRCYLGWRRGSSATWLSGRTTYAGDGGVSGSRVCRSMVLMAWHEGLPLPRVERRWYTILLSSQNTSTNLKVVHEIFPICPGHLIQVTVIVHLF